MRRIAFYGKGGIGKSTTASNVAAAMSDMGLKVMLIGCDPKADSTKLLVKGNHSPTVLAGMREGRSIEESIAEGYGGTVCIECGGPKPGTGCAGRGIIAALEGLEAKDTMAKYAPDVILYDVLGDVVCGGFAMPIRNGYARDVFIISSGEMMSMYAADNIASAIRNLRSEGYATLKGVIQNSRGVENESSLLDKAASEMGSSVIYRIPRDPVVQRSESDGLTVVEGAPDSDLAGRYRELAARILEMSEDSSGGMRLG